ncbi:MAG TPA: HNH endonuclease [Patescibacteria group bacterium]|nr:HNH endonuclease [Patescibacteria group bacterium]
MNKIKDDILSYREMCDLENVQTLQRGMNFRLNPSYSVILMSQRSNAPYKDKIYSDGFSIEYEGHDVNNTKGHDPKNEDQEEKLPSGKLTQNGRFINAVNKFKEGNVKPEPVKVYEKILPGVWSLKGFFDLIEYRVVQDENRNVFRFLLRLSEKQFAHNEENNIELNHTRLIPSEVKKEVWKRDGGKCVKCGSIENLHFDHELPFSKGGTSLTAKNVRLLCMKHNLQKSAKIE